MAQQGNQLTHDARARVAALYEDVVDALYHDWYSLGVEAAKKIRAELASYDPTGLPTPVAHELVVSLYLLAMDALEQNRRKAAVKLLESAARAVPGERLRELGLPIRFALADVYRDLNDFAAAEKALKPVVTWTSTRHLPECWYRLARVREEAGRLDEAAAAYVATVARVDPQIAEPISPWVADAHAGVVRCSNSTTIDRGTGFSFDWWSRGGRRREWTFALLAIAALTSYALAFASAIGRDYEGTARWLTLAVLPLLLLLLPSIRKISLKDWSIEAAPPMPHGPPLPTQSGENL